MIVIIDVSTLLEPQAIISKYICFNIFKKFISFVRFDFKCKLFVKSKS